MISNEKIARKKKHGETTAWKIEDGIRKGIVFKDMATFFVFRVKILGL